MSILSKEIRLYPTAYRGRINIAPSGQEPEYKVFNPESRLNTEENTTRPYIVLCDYANSSDALRHDKGSFVITETYNENNPFEFILHGYYFKILDPRGLFTSSGKNYAKIRISNSTEDDEDNIEFYPTRLSDVSNGTYGNSSLDTATGVDESNFLGLEIVSSITSDISGSYNDYYLLLLDNNQIPESSKLKMDYKVIHGGEDKPLTKLFKGESIKLSNVLKNEAEDVKLDFANNTIYAKSTISTGANVNTPKVSNKAGSNLNIESNKELILKTVAITNPQTPALDIKLESGSNIKLNTPSTKEINLQVGESLESYRLPTVGSEGDNEPSFGEGEEHVLATREWINFTDTVKYPNQISFKIGDSTFNHTVTDVERSLNSDKLKVLTGSSNVSYFIGINNYTPAGNYQDVASIGSRTLFYNKTIEQLCSATETPTVVTEPTGQNSNIFAGTKGIFSSGGICSGSVITASSFNAKSDVRLKENIKEYNCKNSILNLPVVEFDFKSSKTHHIGCIAQDLQKICPEIVHENNEGYLSIEEGKIVYLLLNEVKKLKQEIEELKNR